MKSVLTYNMKDDVFIVYKNETCYVNSQGTEKRYKSLKEYERDMGYILEELYPSNLILKAKSSLGWTLYRLGSKYYEKSSTRKIYYLDKDKRTECTLPKGAVKVKWDKHPYRVLL
jgi:hypothetical protein